MTAGIQGSGPYSKLKDLRFRARSLKQELAARPMGPRTRKRLERELRDLQLQLKEVNAEIRGAKESH